MIGPAKATGGSVRLPAFILAASSLLACAAYSRVLRGEFQFDDAGVIVRNLEIKSLGAAMRSFVDRPIGARPLTNLTFALNYAVGRLSPFGYHLVNVAIHLVTTWVLFLLGKAVLERGRVDRPEIVAGVAAGAFALHPLNTQAVAYLAQRSESLSALLAASTVLLLLRAEQAATWGRAFCVAGALASFGAGVASKTTALVAPFLWLLLTTALPRDPRDPSSGRALRALALLAPLAALAAVVAAVTLSSLRGSGEAGFDIAGVGPTTYLLSEARPLLLYARLFFWPAGQSIEHDFPVVRSLDLTTAAAALLLLFSLTAALLVIYGPSRRRTNPPATTMRVVALGIVWWFICLAPTSSIIPVIDLAAEHRAYLASFGLALGTTAALAHAISMARAPVRALLAIALTTVVFTALAVALHARNGVWETKVALWDDAVAKAPLRARPHANAAFARHSIGDLAGAIDGYRRALELEPHHSANRSTIQQLLGAALAESNRPQEAYEVFRNGLAADPVNLALLNGMAIAALDLGRPAEAEQLMSAALRADPRFGGGMNTMGESLLAQGRNQEALGYFARAASLDPDVPARHYNVAVAAARAGRREQACAALKAYFAAAPGKDPDSAVLDLSASLRCSSDLGGRP